MSKNSRARARQSKKSVMPKTLAVAGLIVVVAAAVAGAHAPTRVARAPSAAVDTPAPPAAPANGAANSVTNTPANAAAPGKQLLFFMNPNGYPCQTQLGILNGVADSLSKVARVVYIKTTDEADMPKFETYGIRGLPTLVIADKDGRELSRFSPGVQSGDAVLAALTR